MTSRQPPNHDDDCSCVLCWNDEPERAWPISKHEFTVLELQRSNDRLRQELDDAWTEIEHLAPSWTGTIGSACHFVRQQVAVLKSTLAAAENHVAKLEAALHEERQARQLAERELARQLALDEQIPHPRRPRRIDERRPCR